MTATVEGVPTRRVYNVHVYQPACPTNGTTDAQPYIQAVINKAIADNVTFSLEFDSHTYSLNNELDFGLATKSFEMYGMGPLRTILQASPTFGISSGSGATLKARAIIRLDMEEAHAQSVASITLRDFDIKGANLLNDPIAIYWPYAWRGKIHRVNVSELGNTVLYAPQSFNVDVAYCSWTNVGSQSLERWIPSDTLQGTMTAGGTTLITNEDIFTSADQTNNRVVFVNNVMVDDNLLTAKIVAYNGPRSVILDTAAQQAGTGYISFDVLKGSIPFNSKTLTVNSATGIVAGDIGRYIYILGAGENGESLNTMVTAVSGSTITVKDAALTAVLTSAKRDVFLGPVISLAFQKSIEDLGGSIHTNDITLNDMHIEQFWGPALFIHHGLGIYLDQFKTEGESPNAQNNFAVSRQAVIQSNSSRMFVGSAQWAYCFTGPDSGTIIQLGTETCNIKIENLLYGGHPIGTHFAEQSDSEHIVVIGDVLSDYDWSFSSLSTRAGGENVYLTGRIVSSKANILTPRSAMTPYFSGTFRSSWPDTLADGAVYSFKPPIDHGIIEFWSGSTTVRGRYYYRATSSPVMSALDTPGSAMNAMTVVLPAGPALKFTVSAALNGRIYIENKTGAGQTPMWHILA